MNHDVVDGLLKRVFQPSPQKREAFPTRDVVARTPKGSEGRDTAETSLWPASKKRRIGVGRRGRFGRGEPWCGVRRKFQDLTRPKKCDNV